MTIAAMTMNDETTKRQPFKERTIALRVEQPLFDKLKAKADATDRPIGYVVREALKQLFG